MATRVRIRQAAEGRKVELSLSPADVKALADGSSLSFSDGDEDVEWEDTTAVLDSGEESAQIAEVRVLAARVTSQDW